MGTRTNNSNRNSFSRILSHNFHLIGGTHLHQDTSNQGPVEVVEVMEARVEVVKAPEVRKQSSDNSGIPLDC